MPINTTASATNDGQISVVLISPDSQLLYSSDYPHWDFDLPSTIYDLPFLSEQAKRNILGGNAMRLYNLDMPRGKMAAAE